ncbi:unnamed protein product [Porites lobata]|uniref:Uncharacterized protein n=1 Tax=Porites lobata TaxID=104759 RepID=A0ABN8MY30_9CNID|nr:unnamed protein product [Porites lobata]
MTQSGIGAASETDVAALSSGQSLDFDDDTLKAKAEVYKTKGNEAYLKEDYSNAIYFYTEGIKVNCKNRVYDVLKAAFSIELKKGSRLVSLNILGLLIYTIFTNSGAKALTRLNLFKLAITWCDRGLAVSFCSFHSCIMIKR